MMNVRTTLVMMVVAVTMMMAGVSANGCTPKCASHEVCCDLGEDMGGAGCVASAEQCTKWQGKVVEDPSQAAAAVGRMTVIVGDSITIRRTKTNSGGHQCTVGAGLHRGQDHYILANWHCFSEKENKPGPNDPYFRYVYKAGKFIGTHAWSHTAGAGLGQDDIGNWDYGVVKLEPDVDFKAHVMGKGNAEGKIIGVAQPAEFKRLYQAAVKAKTPFMVYKRGQTSGWCAMEVSRVVAKGFEVGAWTNGKLECENSQQYPDWNALMQAKGDSGSGLLIKVAPNVYKFAALWDGNSGVRFATDLLAEIKRISKKASMKYTYALSGRQQLPSNQKKAVQKPQRKSAPVKRPTKERKPAQRGLSKAQQRTNQPQARSGRSRGGNLRPKRL